MYKRLGKRSCEPRSKNVDDLMISDAYPSVEICGESSGLRACAHACVQRNDLQDLGLNRSLLL